MAKGVEDCAFYRWSRLTSLNEVGGDPSRLRRRRRRRSTPRWRDRQRDWPHAMTDALDPRHQARRGRPRPDRRARRDARRVGGARSTSCCALAPLPDPGFGSLLWQAILGAWPTSADPTARARCTPTPRRRCARPATAPRGPSRTRPTRRPCTPRSTPPSTTPTCARCSTALRRRGSTRPAGRNALAAKLLALTMPGVPDVYQGSELWEQLAGRPRQPPARRLRPPRRPCSAGDRPTRRRRRAKLLVTCAALHAAPRPARAVHDVRPARRDRRRPPTTSLAFDRGGAVTVATRLPVGLAAAAAGATPRSTCPPGSWRDVLTGARHRRSAGRPARRPTRSPCWCRRTR